MGKKQHYVPKVVLRNFSKNGLEKEINLFVVDTHIVVVDGALKDQAKENNLYGSDQKLEELFNEIEGRIAPVFAKLLNGETDLSFDEEVSLRQFLIFQLNRTPQAESDLQSVFDKQAKFLLREKVPDKSKLSSLRARLTHPYHLMFQVARDIAPVLADLVTGVVVNETSEPFVLGQDPVLTLNPFLVAKGWRGPKIGLGAKGVLLFLPISPRVAVVLYDKFRYRFSSEKRTVSILPSDVVKLNMGQFLLTDSCVYFSGDPGQIPLVEYSEKTRDFRLKDKSIVRVFNAPVKNGREQMLHHLKVETPFAQDFDFVRLKAGPFAQVLNERSDITRESAAGFLQSLEKNRNGSTMPLKTQEQMQGKRFEFEEEL